jgi:hypothetical protein
MEDKDILALNKLLNHKNREFGLDMDVVANGVGESLTLDVDVRGLGSYVYSGIDAIDFIRNPVILLAKSNGVSKRHLLAFYSANNDDLNRCQSLTQKGHRCTRPTSKTIDGIKEFIPNEVYLCSQHEEHGYLK